jgi:hypothetical protein
MNSKNIKADKPDDPRLNLSMKAAAITAIITIIFVIAAPAIWKRVERFDITTDYRMPYSLSEDYSLYERRLERMAPNQIPILGDSVIWGEYVWNNGTLSHFLNREAGKDEIFVNAGVNGLFPLALEGLLRHYGNPIRNRKVILHCNVLWMTGAESDLSTTKEHKFNHVRLVPQFSHRIPCYRADFNDRAGIVITRQSRFFSWVGHIQSAYFEQKNLYAWTLADDDKYPPSYPNATRNPIGQITFKVPAEPRIDSERGPDSPRHKPWSTTGIGTQNFDWVPLNKSLQWAAFQRTLKLLRKRDNDILVIIGPFNQHVMTAKNRNVFDMEVKCIQYRLNQQNIPYISPALLDSKLYGDSSHPLTEGYRQLAKEISNAPAFQTWLQLH